MIGRAAVLSFLLGLALLNFFWFPGHTYLQADTQIYIPLLEKLWDPSLYPRELVTSRPHLAYTIYDEVARVLRTVTHLPFRYVLEAQQVVFRTLGLAGVYLIGTALGLGRRGGLIVAALFGLGATIVGPAVLIFEYEPVPRGFAVMLVFLALGLTMRGKLLYAGAATSIAFLYHAPTTIPFWIVFALVCVRTGRRSLVGWAPLAAAIAFLVVLSRFQPGISEKQVFFGRLDPVMEQIQKLRAMYNWVSLWPPQVFWHYAALAGAAVAAIWRIRPTVDQRIVLLGLVAIGVVSVPFSYLVLDVWGWALMPQYQPARAVLFITAVAVIACSTAAVLAGRRQRWAEAAAWCVVPVILPLNTKSMFDPMSAAQWAVLAGSALLLGYALSICRIPALRLAAICVLFIAIPVFGGVRNYARLWTPDLVQLSDWARTSTSKDALFHFPGARRELYPGVFRAEALRSVYVDWKVGGQVNYFKSLGTEWWARFQQTILQSASADDLRARGIDYVVTKSTTPWQGGTLVYSNPSYNVYRL
jgi:hypothetical protein